MTDGEHSHTDPHHHAGPCDEACRRAMRPHYHPSSASASSAFGDPTYPGPHLYRGRSGASTHREIVEHYAAQFRSEGEPPAQAREHAERVYGATVGKVRRERMRRSRRGVGPGWAAVRRELWLVLHGWSDTPYPHDEPKSATRRDRVGLPVTARGGDNGMNLSERMKVKIAAWRARMRAGASTLRGRGLRQRTDARVDAQAVGFGLAVVGGVLALAALVGVLFVPATTFSTLDAELFALFGAILLVVGVAVDKL